jgi:hypothetical protein
MRLPYSLFGAAAAAWMLAAPLAHGFTIENKDSEGQYGVPKFDLEEQSKNFRKDGTGTVVGSGKMYETPIGDGKLQFGVTQGSASGFGSPFSAQLGPGNSAAQRQHLDRMLSPPSSLDYDRSR